VKHSFAPQSYGMTKRTKQAWTKWRRLIREQARSGQTVTAFCRDRGLCRPYFFTWKKRLQEGTQAVVFDLADESVITDTVFPELSKARAVQRLSNAARIV